MKRSRPAKRDESARAFRFTPGLSLALALAVIPAHLRAEPLPDVFRTACANLAGAGDSLDVAGSDGWFYVRNEIRHLAAGPFWGASAAAANPSAPPDQADPLPAIVNFNDQLKALGISLVFVPVPAKAVIHPEPLKLAAAPEPRLDAAHQECFRLLRERGVAVLDVVPAMLAARAKAPMYCRTDTHYSPAGMAVVARAIADAIKAQPWCAAHPTRKYVGREKTITVAGDLVRDAKPPVREELKIVEVTDADGAVVADDPASPVLLLTDSHGLVYHDGDDMLAERAGLSDRLALELGFPVNLIGCRGSAATPVRVTFLRRVRGDPAYLKTKKAIVWCLSVREFTGSPWNAKLPAP